MTLLLSESGGHYESDFLLDFLSTLRRIISEYSYIYIYIFLIERRTAIQKVPYYLI